MITSGINMGGQRGATLWTPLHMSYLTESLCRTRQIRRCLVLDWRSDERQWKLRERWCEAEVHRIAGEIAMMRPQAGCGESGSLFRARSLAVARQQASQILGTPRLHEPRPPLARPGQATGSSRTARSVYGWFTEGFDTRDLKDAKELLAELAS